MSNTPAIAAPIPNATRRPLVVLLVAVALFVSAFVLPQSEQAAHAVTAKRITARVEANYATQMLALLNQERRAHGRKPLVMAAKLRLSAHRHNLHMAARNTMSHQLPGEPFFATRISNAGYHWSAAGENIGWNSDQSVKGLLYLEREMYNERPPNDGHRENILSSQFTQVGIDVYYDATHHKIWFTQDFARPR
jgi:uncharacterized protein YkwD